MDALENNEWYFLTTLDSGSNVRIKVNHRNYDAVQVNRQADAPNSAIFKARLTNNNTQLTLESYSQEGKYINYDELGAEMIAVVTNNNDPMTVAVSSDGSYHITQEINGTKYYLTMPNTEAGTGITFATDNKENKKTQKWVFTKTRPSK